MRIAFVQTYPVYHDQVSQSAWLSREDRDRWMPAILAADGHEVELWAGANAEEVHLAVADETGMAAYPIRLFRAEGGRRTKFHTSQALVHYARGFGADLVVLKGIDGGIGVHLLEKYLVPEKVPFAFVVGGKFYTRYVPKAAAVFYETDEQRCALISPGVRFWRRPVLRNRLIRLPKSLDTSVFRPTERTRKEWDVLSVGRLDTRLKSYDELGKLSRSLRVAVAGSGPSEAELRDRYPDVDWLGFIPHRQLPGIFNRARIFMHAGIREYFPRVIAEAASCGIPSVAFADAIKADVLPDSCGLRVDHASYESVIHALLRDPERLQRMSRESRHRAEQMFNKFSSREPMLEMLDLVMTPRDRDRAATTSNRPRPVTTAGSGSHE